MKSIKKIPLYLQILLGMAAGLLFGLAVGRLGKQGTQFISDWVSPWGLIFLNLLKLLAVPLIIASLTKGISGLKDISSLSRMGFRTLFLYMATTVLAITIGLLVVNAIEPGALVAEETRAHLMQQFSGDSASRLQVAAMQKSRGPLQALVDLVPQNIFSAASSNANMLQVIFFVVLFGIGLTLIPKEKAAPLIQFFESLDAVVLKMIDLVMLLAPLGVFALMARLVSEAPSADILYAMLGYMGSVVLGLSLLILVVYPALVHFYAGQSPIYFFRGMLPAQLLAFSTSSSAATLPVTMERVTEHLGVEEEVASFVLPVGATVNMDGTSLYQGVAAVFIAQVFGNDLGLSEQITIVLTATLASIGSAAVPGAGLLMLIIVLEAIGVNPAGIALILAVDRPLDMCRTMANVTGDATVSLLVERSLGKRSSGPTRKL